jgi:hypothetical protein
MAKVSTMQPVIDMGVTFDLAALKASKQAAMDAGNLDEAFRLHDQIKQAEERALVNAPKPQSAQQVAESKTGKDRYAAMVAWTHKAIKTLRKVDGQSKGIHTVYSGFNGAFSMQYSLAKEQVVVLTNTMRDKGDIDMRPVKGGVMIYLPGEKPVGDGGAAVVLARINA